jgi:hypothetical protein
LFHQAIMMSGSDRCPWATIEPLRYAVNYAEELAKAVGCPYDDHQRLVDCLRLSRTVDEIVNGSAKVRLMVSKIFKSAHGKDKKY